VPNVEANYTRERSQVFVTDMTANRPSGQGFEQSPHYTLGNFRFAGQLSDYFEQYCEAGPFRARGPVTPHRWM